MKRPIVWVLLAGMTMVLSWFVWLGKPDFPLDDAYIVQHTVEGLLHGGEDRYAGVSPIQGATSTLHVLLIYLLGSMMPIAWGQLLLAGAAFLLFVAGVYALARLEGMPEGHSAGLSAFTGVAGLSLYHFMNGLETGLAMAAIVWTLVAFHKPSPRQPWHGVLLGLLPFIRPELAALSVIVIIREIWAFRYASGKLKGLLPIIGWPLLGSLIPVTFLLLAGGSLLPNTMSAKVHFFAEWCQPLVIKMQMSGSIVTRFLQGLGIFSIGLVGLAFSRYRSIAVVFIAVFLTAYVLSFPGALAHNYYRYLYLLTPFMVAGWVALLTVKIRIPLLITRTVLLIAALETVFLLPGTMAKYEGGISLSRVELAGVSRWISKNLPNDTVVLIHDAGYISLHGNQPLVDLVGLKTPSSVVINRDSTLSRGARDPLVIDKIARHSGASYFVVLDGWDRIFALTKSLRSTGWIVERADTDRGKTSYKIYRIKHTTISTKASND